MGKYDSRLTIGTTTGNKVPNGGVYYNNTRIIKPGNVRYIKITCNGSTANIGNHLVEVMAYTYVYGNDSTNYALGKSVTSNDIQNGSYPWSRVTDGNSDTNVYAAVGTLTTIDLGAEYDINSVKVWRYYADGRTYYETSVKGYNASDELVRVYHDYTTDGVYAENSYGRLFGLTNIGQNITGDASYNTRHIYLGTTTGNKRVTLNRTVTRRSTSFSLTLNSTYWWYGGTNWNNPNGGDTQGWYTAGAGYNGAAFMMFFADPLNVLNQYSNWAVTDAWLYATRSNSSGLATNSEGNFCLSNNTTASGWATVLNGSGNQYTLPNAINSETYDNNAYLSRSAGWDRNVEKAWQLFGNSKYWLYQGWRTPCFYSSWQYQQKSNRYFRIDSKNEGRPPRLTIWFDYDDISWT